MPIDIDEFEDRDDRERTTSERVVHFLGAQRDRAFTRREIADAIDVPPETVGTNLTRLKRRGLVRHREPYWAIADDADRAIEGSDQDAELGDVDGEEAGPHERAAVAFFERVREEVPEVDELYLFGSVARGRASPDSDVDVLAVVSDEANFADVDDRLLGLAYDVQVDHDVPVEVHSVRAEEFEARKRRGEPFVRTVVEEGIVGG